MSSNCPDRQKLDEIFPKSRSDEFFDAIYGGAEEGAYDIILVCNNVTDTSADFAFELRKRPGKCLKCSLTYGLPDVFKRHPLLNIAGVAEKLAELIGWESPIEWKLGQVKEISDSLHIIPFILHKA